MIPAHAASGTPRVIRKLWNGPMKSVGEEDDVDRAEGQEHPVDAGRLRAA